MLQNSINNNRSGLVGALLLFVLTFSFSACEDKLTIDNRRGENDKQIQDYLRANNIDPATLVNTKSGLYYQKLEEGTGAKVYAGDNVSVHYKGTLLNGTEFDTSYDDNKPLELKVGVGQVIRGWDEGLQLMKEGEKGRLFVPAYLAYEGQNRGTIPPYSVLVFEMHIVDIK
ncbi:FKBP-type peptidyl-prolyl cis-trans isomerase [Pontibacter rugosus]|uniref:Peptidyl-prolyl cis-trans isomerase n=1 Tax=Pontibacter rugosus TaxID=1745966 RepID=A0ABW3SJI5_9BACT